MKVREVQEEAGRCEKVGKGVNRCQKVKGGLGWYKKVWEGTGGCEEGAIGVGRCVRVMVMIVGLRLRLIDYTPSPTSQEAAG